MITTAITSRLVVHTASQDTGLTQVTEAMEAWYDHPEFDPDLPVLWDMRAAEVSPPQEDLDLWSEYNRTLINEKRPGCKTAWVFGSIAVADFAVDLLGAHDWQHRVRIFANDIEAAKAWLTSSIR